jgi:serine/threonine protein kinase
LRATSKHKFASYLAQFYGAHRGDDGRFFLVEELLDRPLDRLAPLNDLVLFSRIARDLCRGLCCLHAEKLVHRDLKLDNCGMDQLQKAKIFDLGTVTSEPGGVEGTILTRPPELFNRERAPELFKGEPSALISSDIWALGATLYALRSGSYPFVHLNEIEARRAINLRLRRGRILNKVASEKKGEIDKQIEDRIFRKGAVKGLKDRVRGMIRGRAEEILTSMLEWDASARGTAEAYEIEWTNLSNELGSCG